MRPVHRNKQKEVVDVLRMFHARETGEESKLLCLKGRTESKVRRARWRGRKIH